MKRVIIALVICLSVLLTLSAGAVCLRGDVDQNGSRTILDAFLLVRSFLNGRTLSGSDVNRDGRTDLLDAVKIFQLIVEADEPEDVDGLTLLEFVSDDHSPKAAGDAVMRNMLRVSSEEMKGTHDADYVFANGKAYIVYEANNEKPGDPGTYEKEYCALAIVDLATFTVDSIEKFAYGEQVYSNITMLKGSAYVPRVIRKDEDTLRFFFSNNAADGSSGYLYFVDYDLATGVFGNTATRLKIMTPGGAVDFTAETYAALFRADGHICDDSTIGHFLFDIFDVGDTKYIALNNFRGAQNSLAKFNETYDCIEIVGNIGGATDAYRTTESGIIQCKDGSWMSILRDHVGDKRYSFSYSEDGRTWTEPAHQSFMPTGYTAKPTLDRFGDYYFMGYNDLSRGLFHLAYSLDALHWTTLFSFHSPTTFQYPRFDIYDGQMYFSATTGEKEKIFFGKLPIYEKNGDLYIEEQHDEVEDLFADLSGFTLLYDGVQTNDNGRSFTTYVRRDENGVYFYAESPESVTDDKLIFLIDTAGTATKLSATASPDNLMFRFYGNSHVQTVYAEGTRGYRTLATFADLKFFRRMDANGTKIGIFLPYTAIPQIAPFAAAANASTDLYVAVYGADASSGHEYSPVIAGRQIKYSNPTTYARFTPAGEITSRS
ncbi:MAG: hypothetical protein IJU41_04685 [Clostridia bacterium]|nr:hypothetical protein [Clostridia bacterium]